MRSRRVLRLDYLVFVCLQADWFYMVYIN